MIRVWNVEKKQTEWVGFSLQLGETVCIAASGEVLDGDPATLEREFFYLVETPTGTVDIVRPSRFFKLMDAALRKAATSNQDQSQNP